MSETGAEKAKTPPKGQKSSGRKIELLVGLLAIAVIIGIGALVWQKYRHNKATTAKNAACSASILKQAAAAFPDGKEAQLQQVVTQIQTTPNYQTDPNCLYIIASYYVHISDYTNAQNYLKKLEAIDPQGQHIDVSPLYTGKVALDTLSTQVSFLQQQQNTSDGVIPSEESGKP